jgi:hypothetical protein
MKSKTEKAVKKVEATAEKPDTIRKSIQGHVLGLGVQLNYLRSEEKSCINERAHEKQFYAGRALEVANEIEYLNALLFDS